MDWTLSFLECRGYEWAECIGRRCQRPIILHLGGSGKYCAACRRDILEEPWIVPYIYYRAVRDDEDLIRNGLTPKGSSPENVSLELLEYHILHGSHEPTVYSSARVITIARDESGTEPEDDIFDADTDYEYNDITACNYARSFKEIVVKGARHPMCITKILTLSRDHMKRNYEWEDVNKFQSFLCAQHRAPSTGRSIIQVSRICHDSRNRNRNLSSSSFDTSSCWTNNDPRASSTSPAVSRTTPVILPLSMRPSHALSIVATTTNCERLEQLEDTMYYLSVETSPIRVDQWQNHTVPEDH
eukprot:scaffold5122_cov60-Attheya_sp.AAC.6